MCVIFYCCDVEQLKVVEYVILTLHLSFLACRYASCGNHIYYLFLFLFMYFIVGEVSLH